MKHEIGVSGVALRPQYKNLNHNLIASAFDYRGVRNVGWCNWIKTENLLWQKNGDSVGYPARKAVC